MDWDKARNILCIRLDSIGDVIMTTPAFRALKDSGPGRRLTLLTSRSARAVAPLIPEIDETIDFDAPWMKATAPRDTKGVDLSFINRLHRRDFDAAVIFTVFSQSPLPAAYMSFLAEIPLRLAHCRENPYQLLTNWVKETDTELSMRHEVERQLDLVGSIGCKITSDSLSLMVPVVAMLSIEAKLERLQGFDVSKPWIVIHPGATAESRRYSASQYATVADILASKFQQQIIFTGVESEWRLVESIRANVRTQTFSLAGSLDLEEMGALIKLAPLLITNNTGPAHMAAALETPVVDLYALTNPQHTPWTSKSRVLSHDVPCKNCFKSVCPMQHHDCLGLVNPVDVVDAALELLGDNSVNRNQTSV